MRGPAETGPLWRCAKCDDPTEKPSLGRRLLATVDQVDAREDEGELGLREMADTLGEDGSIDRDDLGNVGDRVF